MSVTVIERKVDEKRRVTLPPLMNVKEGSQVVMIASKDAAVVASDRKVAERLSNALRDLEKERKHKVVEEWAKLVEEAGLAGLRARDIDKLVDEGILDRGSGRGREESRS